MRSTELLQTDAALRESEERYRALFNVIDEGFCVIEMLFDTDGKPVDYRFVEVNTAFEDQTGLVGVVGKRIREFAPDLEANWFEIYGKVALTGEPIRFENRAEQLGRYFDAYAFRLGDPKARNVAIFFKDITQRKRADDALLASEERFRTLFESLGQGVVFHDAITGSMIGANPAAEQILGMTFSQSAQRTITDAAWQALNEDGEPLPPDQFPTARALATGQASGEEIMGVFNPQRQEHRFLQVAAVPQFRTGEDKPFLVYTLFDDITERRALEQERARLWEETQAQALRERVINQIGQAVRDTSLTPDEVQKRATALLGQALNLDRCYFSVFDPQRNILQIGGDWRRPDLPPLSGRRSGTGYTRLSAEFYPPRSTSIAYRDVREARFSEENQRRLADFGFRAVVGVAYREKPDSPITAALGAVMVDGPRDWTADEIEILEASATLVWTTLEAIRRQQREHHIASQLQDALIPATPPSPPGLELASYYQPALDEAEVGGDFYDVFPIEKGCTALVVADLSGKGLAAARQVATVRNMLRFALYDAPSLSDAITRLNHNLVEHELLVGFATLFVGVYEQGTRTLTYVNCGQEPGIVYRTATGETEELLPTGPVLGGFDTAPFAQRSVTLAPGDVLALFTDGLTEVGPSRREQLEATGVAALLQTCVRESGLAAQEVSDRLIAGIDAYARGTLRDDVALLVGTVL